MCKERDFLLCVPYFLRFNDDGAPLPFNPSRVRWLKAINKVRVQLREVSHKNNNNATVTTNATLVEFSFLVVSQYAVSHARQIVGACCTLILYTTKVQGEKCLVPT